MITKEQSVNLLWNTLSREAYLRVNKNLIKSIGLEATIILSSLIDRDKYFYENRENYNGWFYFTMEKMEEFTGLKRHKQDRGIKFLEEQSYIESKIQGIPSKKYFSLNYEKIAMLMLNKGQKQLNSDWNSGSRQIRTTVPGRVVQKNKQKSEQYYQDVGGVQPRLQESYKLNNKNIAENKNRVISSLSKRLDKEEMDVSKKRPAIFLPVSKRRKQNLKIPKPKIPIEDLLDKKYFSLLCYWNRLGKPIKKHRENIKYKGTRKALELIRAKLNNGTSPRKIKLTMDRYYNFLKNFNFNGKNVAGYNVGLQDFFGFTDFTRKMVLKHKDGKVKVSLLDMESWFDECSKNSIEELLEKFPLFEPTLKDNYPLLTEHLKDLYGNIVLRRKNPSYSQKQINHFVRASRKLVKYRDDLEKEYAASISLASLAKYLIKSLKAAFEDNGIVTGHLSSDYTFNQVLPNYLEQQAVMDWVSSGVSFSKETSFGY